MRCVCFSFFLFWFYMMTLKGKKGALTYFPAVLFFNTMLVIFKKFQFLGLFVMLLFCIVHYFCVSVIIYSPYTTMVFVVVIAEVGFHSCVYVFFYCKVVKGHQTRKQYQQSIRQQGEAARTIQVAFRKHRVRTSLKKRRLDKVKKEQQSAEFIQRSMLQFFILILGLPYWSINSFLCHPESWFLVAWSICTCM